MTHSLMDYYNFTSVSYADETDAEFIAKKTRCCQTFSDAQEVKLVLTAEGLVDF